MTSWRTIN